MLDRPDRLHAPTALLLGTVMLVVSFLVWSLLAPLASTFQTLYGLTNTQISLVIAAPVLVGALGRIPVGAFADRYGGRITLTVCLALQAIPLLLLGFTRNYGSLLGAAVLLGVAGVSFSGGAPFVSRWFAPAKQGLALGIYGMGNIGTAVSGLLAPRIAAAYGWQWAFWGPVPVVLGVALLLYLVARDAPRPAAAVKPPGIGAALGRPLAWLFSFWYFVTFGGFVAFGGYLPKLYVDLYGLSKTEAGSWASVFVIGATLCRPAGGWVADRIGGRRAVAISLVGIAALAALLTLALPLGPFRATILVMGLFFGLGNGAVFKLVPQYFPAQAGAVTGLVGALGALGGFFPPLVMGQLRDRLGTYTPAFALLAVTAAAGWLLVGLLSEGRLPWQQPREEAALQRLEQLFVHRATLNAFSVTAVLAALIYFGSGRLRHLDPALYGYGIGTVVALIGLTFRLTAWLMRPATRVLAGRLVRNLFRPVLRRAGVVSPIPAGVGRWQEGRHHPGGTIAARNRPPATQDRLPATRGGDPGLRPEAAAAAQAEAQSPRRATPGPAVALRTLVQNILLNRFIFRRGLRRGVQHFLIMWGVLGSFAITIPLTFGWLHFEAVGQSDYRVVAFGLPLFTMPVHGLLAGLIYHGLSTFAVLTLIGVSLALIRRLLDRDARVDQRLLYDLFPLYLLLAVTLTGLALTVSHIWGGGWGYPLISVIHQITVVLLLLYLPFGKLFHIPMRALSIAADLYHEVEAHEGLASCVRCQKIYATRAQIQDVVRVLKETGMSLLAPDGKTALAEYCPECRRVLRGLLYSRRELRPEERGGATVEP